MMYLSTDNFKNDWKELHDSTFILLNSLTNASLQATMPIGVRSIQTLAWHIVYTVSEIPNTAGLVIYQIQKDKQAPNTVTEIIEEFKKASNSLLENIDAWQFNELSNKVNMYGEDWTKGKVLQVLVNHHIHHCGQLTTLMSIAGLKVLGLYGPSKSDWLAMGMEPSK